MEYTPECHLVIQKIFVHDRCLPNSPARHQYLNQPPSLRSYIGLPKVFVTQISALLDDQFVLLWHITRGWRLTFHIMNLGSLTMLIKMSKKCAELRTGLVRYASVWEGKRQSHSRQAQVKTPLLHVALQHHQHIGDHQFLSLN